MKFETAIGAENALEMIKDLKQETIDKTKRCCYSHLACGKKKQKTKHLADLTGAGALSGAFSGMLFGLIFFIPLLGLVAGAAIGALSGSMTHIGIDEDFIKSIRSKVTEGTSALFLMTTDAVEDKVVEAMKQTKFEIIASNMSKEEEDKLRTAFAEE